MESPRLSIIRIRYSESDALHEGQQFDTLADFDAAMRAASFTAPDDGCYFKVAFVATWSNGARFSGRIDLERHDYGGLAAHIAEVCADIESAPALADLVSRARCFRSLISLTVHQEQQAASDRRIAELRQQLDALRAEMAECSARALN